MKYDLNLKKKHESIYSTAELNYKLLKKYIGREIFSTFEIFCKDEDGAVDYGTAKRLYEKIIKDDICINLKYRLCLSGVNAISELISNEYADILKLQNENEELKRELKYYKKLNEINI